MKTVSILIFCYYLFFKINNVVCPNYTIYEITAFNQRERKVLYNIYTKEDQIIFMNGVSNEAAIPIDVAVEAKKDHLFAMTLHAFDIKYVYFPEHRLYFSTEPKKEEQAFGYSDVSNTFLDWNSILNWADLQDKKSQIFQKIVIAKTYERRDIFIIKISNGNNKPIVFIVGGEDGKDWISSAIVLNFANNLLESMDNRLLKEYDFYLLPVLNPDGFVYSKTTDRFWSKNRRIIFPPVNCLKNTAAVGVNIARNWFFKKVNKILHEECKSFYIGYKPLSEEETQTLSYVLNSIAINMIAFINVKGFGKFITIPYAHNGKSNNHDIIIDILTSACTTVKTKYNITYYVDTTNRFIYNATGIMADWVKKKLNIPIVFTAYMEYQNDLFPNPEHIYPLTEHFYTILNETLLVSRDIYGPLFNNQMQTYIKFKLTVFLMIMSYKF